MTAPKSDDKIRKESLEALAQYQRAGAISDDIADMADMLTDESDRGVAVILGSLLEDILLERIVEAFPNPPAREKDLARSGALLSSFADRITLAYSLGIIDDGTVEMLNVIKAIRNACAHSRRHIEFTTPEMKAVLELIFDEETRVDIRGTSHHRALRWMFILGFHHIKDRLRGYSREDAVRRSQMMMDAMNIHLNEALEKHRESLEKRRERRVNRDRQNPKG